MKQILTVLLLTLTACAANKENSGRPYGPGAMQDSLVGRWTSGCKSESPDRAEKLDMELDGSSGVFLSRLYGDEFCKGPVVSTTGPNPFTYTVKNKPGLGKATIILSDDVGGKPMVSEAVLFDDVLNVKIWGTEIKFFRLPPKTK